MEPSSYHGQNLGLYHISSLPVTVFDSLWESYTEDDSIT